MTHNQFIRNSSSMAPNSLNNLNILNFALKISQLNTLIKTGYNLNFII